MNKQYDDWQPMESAPKSGRFLALIECADGDIPVPAAWRPRIGWVDVIGKKIKPKAWRQTKIQRMFPDMPHVWEWKEWLSKP